MHVSSVGTFAITSPGRERHEVLRLEPSPQPVTPPMLVRPRTTVRTHVSSQTPHKKLYHTPTTPSLGIRNPWDLSLISLGSVQRLDLIF